MKEIVQQILDIYFKNMRQPTLWELSIGTEINQEKGCCFITLYINGEVRGSAGNIKEIHGNIVEELLDNTMQALTGDKRFSPLKLEEAEKIQFQVDIIDHREMIHLKDINTLDPVKNGIIAIKRDYKKLATILPNISPKLMTGDDFIPVLQKKLDDKKITDKTHIFYQITTQVETNF